MTSHHFPPTVYWGLQANIIIINHNSIHQSRLFTALKESIAFQFFWFSKKKSCPSHETSKYIGLVSDFWWQKFLPNFKSIHILKGKGCRCCGSHIIVHCAIPCIMSDIEERATLLPQSQGSSLSQQRTASTLAKIAVVGCKWYVILLSFTFSPRYSYHFIHT